VTGRQIRGIARYVTELASIAGDCVGEFRLAEDFDGFELVLFDTRVQRTPVVVEQIEALAIEGVTSDCLPDLITTVFDRAHARMLGQ